MDFTALVYFDDGRSFISLRSGSGKGRLFDLVYEGGRNQGNYVAGKSGMNLSNIHDLHLPQRFEDLLHRRFLFNNLLDNFYLG